MHNSIIGYAYKAYKNKEYIKALQLYKIAAKKIGEKNIAVNIKICESHLIKESNLHFCLPLFKSSKCFHDKKFKCLCILDDYSMSIFSNQIDLIQLDINNYETQIENTAYDFVFLESCWNGNGGMWKYAFISPKLIHPNSKKLIDALTLIRKRGKKIIFWNKEDPLHFDKFICIAKYCDYILTTDSDCIKKYKYELCHNNIDVMPFFVNPTICNPCNRIKYNAKQVCFAGSYYTKNHDNRLIQMSYILPVLLKHSGTIYDRYSEDTSGKYKFPIEYNNIIKPAIPFSSMPMLYKQFKVFLNVNTVTKSPTMMSRRVYEILGSGTPVVSSPSLAIKNVFSGIVLTASNTNEANNHVENLLNDNAYWNRVSHIGYREVMEKHTFSHASYAIYKFIDKTYKQPKKPCVSIIIASCREENTDLIIENITRQSYKNIEVVLALTDYRIENIDKIKRSFVSCNNITNVIISEFSKDVPLGRCLNESIKKSHGEFIAKMDDDNFYFEHYLSDMLIPFKFNDYDVVGKECYFCYLEGMDKLILRFPNRYHCNTKFVAGDAMILRRNIFEKTSFPETRVGEDTAILQSIIAFGGKIYSADYFNFVKFRSSNLLKQTWMVEEEDLINKSHLISSGKNFNLVKC